MAPIHSWRWRVQGPPDAGAALDSRWHEHLAKHRHQPFRRKWGGDPEGPPRVTVHSDGLALASNEELRWLSVLLSFTPRQIDAVRTPTATMGAWLQILSFLDSIRYGNVFDTPVTDRRVEVRLRGTHTSMRDVEGQDFLLRRVLPSSASDEDRRTMAAAWKDMEAHESLGRDIFLTADPIVLRYRPGLAQHLRVWILTAPETLDYFETIAKGQGRYLFNGVTTCDRWTYYDERAGELVPVLRRVWRAVHGWSDGNREVVLDYLASLRARLCYLMEARDHIGYLYYTPAGLDSNDAALYHLNYFFLLAAAAFDNVAWVLQHVYNLGLPRTKVGLHNQEFRRAIGQPFKPVCVSHDKLLRVFQEPRHSVAHRLLMWGIGFRDRATGGGSNLVEIGEDLADAIEGVDSSLPDRPYGEWGLARVGPVALLEPYRFTAAALREILSLVEGFLSLLLADATLGWQVPPEPGDVPRPPWIFTVPFFGPIV